MTDWQKLLIELCGQARIVALNRADVTRQEMVDLCDLANKVEAVVISEINARSK